MFVGKLELEEHSKTRELWEDVFEEDTESFLDYYYKCMTDHNCIYGIEEHDQMVSMLHLNPYLIQFGEVTFPIQYIVGVATKESHRKRGFMGALLRESLQGLYHAGEPLTYLMPAAEAIYTPYDFVTIGEQIHYKYIGEMEDGIFISEDQHIRFEYANDDDCERLAQFANGQFEKKYTAFIRRNSSYFKQLIREQASQNGGIVLVKKDFELVGYFITANDEYQQVREIVLEDGVELQVEEKRRIPMMVRIICVELLLKCLELDGIHLRGNESAVIQVVDDIIDDNTGTYEIWKYEKKIECKKISNEVDLNQTITMQELTKRVFCKEKVLLNEIV